MATKHNDPRAGHIVHVFEGATNVKFPHRGYIISLAADGQETFVFDSRGEQVKEFPSTTALAVRDAVVWIDWIDEQVHPLEADHA
jgi:hypothetical protein